MRLVRTLLLILAALLPSASLQADPGDIDAAARGVVRVVIVGREGEEVFPVSHGSGFTVAPGRIVTNAHVVAEAASDPTLRVAIVPPESGGAVLGRIVAIDARRDLALIAIAGGDPAAARLPALALAGGAARDSGDVAAVGYPMNVDRAQGLGIDDIFSAQPPVKSRGFLSGSRPSRDVDTVLHTAPIARGNSGGPLLDGCGRVVGVNSFGAESNSADAEFFFAVTMRELLPFLREHNVAARINQSDCRSLAELDAAEAARNRKDQDAARAALAERASLAQNKAERARFAAAMRVLSERDDRLLGSMVLLLLAAGLGWWAWEKRERLDGADAPLPMPRANRIAAASGAALALGALFLQITRPGIDEIDRLATASDPKAEAERGNAPGAARSGTRYLCRLDPERSRVTTSATDDVALTWTANGCVNGRTQYGDAQGIWNRVLVPNDDQEVSVNSFDPKRREFRTERFLLSQAAMRDAREARGRYAAPACGEAEAARTLGEQQRSVMAALPAQANERLVYSCDIITR